MSDYTKSVDFAAKDALVTGNPLKVVRGTEIDTEFNNIATSIGTKADLASPALSGTPTAPTPSGTPDDNEIATVEYVRDQLYLALPIGMIMQWGGTAGAYPAGWELCDGSTYTRSDGAGSIIAPDLSDKFIVAKGSSRTEQSTGGSDSHGHTTGTSGSHNHTGTSGSTALTIAQMPAHTHTTNATPTPSGSTWPFQGGPGYGVTATTSSSTGGGAGHTHTISTDGDHSHTVSSGSNVPAYFALAFLIRI
jgi:microcystin-dependent protein